jgi:hypothetical protein
MDGREDIIFNVFLLIIIITFSGCIQTTKTENVSDQDLYDD